MSKRIKHGVCKKNKKQVRDSIKQNNMIVE
jgi:hypothetical protein